MTKNRNVERRQTASMWIANTGLFLIMAAIALPLLRFGGDVYKYVFATGAALVLVGRIINVAPSGTSLRVRRLVRMELWSGIVFCVGAFFMFYPGVGPTDWLAFTLAGGAIQAYTSLMLPRAIRKESAEK